MSLVLHKFLLDPIPSLPDEVLLQVFKFVMPFDDGIDMIGKHDIWSIREVCGRWCNIVDNTSQFWCKFNYTATEDEISDELLQSRTETCVRFSTSALLHVSILRRMTKKMFESIVSQAPRVHTFVIDVHVLHDLYSTGHFPSADFGQLRSLSLQDNCRFSHVTAKCESCPYKFFISATGLEEVKLQHVILDNAQQLSWGKVKTLTISDDSPTKRVSHDFAYRLLRNLPHLENVTFIDKYYSGDMRHLVLRSVQPDESKPVTIRSLRTLNVHSDIFQFHKLSLPGLTTLRLSNQCFCEYDTDSVASMVKRSKCMLKNLDVMSCLLHGFDVFTALEHFPPSIEQLTLTFVYYEGYIEGLQSLLGFPNKLRVLPGLKYLNFRITLYRTTFIDTDHLAQVIIKIMRSRAANGRSDELHGCSPALESIKCDIRLDRSQGKLDLPSVEEVGKQLGMEFEAVHEFWQ